MSEVYRGRVEGGVVVFSGAGAPQEGAEVLVVRMDDSAGPPDPTQAETAGLDVSEHGMWGYPEFYVPVPGGYGTESHGHLGLAHAARSAATAAAHVPVPEPS